MHNGNEIIYNSSGGNIILNSTCKVEGKAIFNNLSKYTLFVNGKIGDGAVINVREDYPSNLYISTDIPAGATVNY